MKTLLVLLLSLGTLVSCDTAGVRELIDTSLQALEKVDYVWISEDKVCLKSKVEGEQAGGSATFKIVEPDHCRGEVFALEGDLGKNLFKFGEYLYSKDGALKVYLPKSDLCLDVELQDVDLEKVDARWKDGKSLAWKKLPRVEDPECKDAVVLDLPFVLTAAKSAAKKFAYSLAAGLLKAQLIKVVE